jgi:hypothetical protein
MPRFDGPGPIGAAPATGRGLGRPGASAVAGLLCSRKSLPGIGRGGLPRGGGRGRCFGGGSMGSRSFNAPFITTSEEVQALKAKLSATEDRIAEIKARLEKPAKKE